MARLVMVHVSEVSEATCLAFRMLGASGSSGEVAGCFEVAITGEGGGGECFLFHAICRKKWGGGLVKVHAPFGSGRSVRMKVLPR